MRRKILALLIESGFQITPDALEFILTLEFPLETIESVILVKKPAESPSILSKEYIESLVKGHDTFSKPIESFTEVHDEHPEPPSISDSVTNIPEWQFRIDKNPDDGAVGSEGTLEDFLEMFRDRFDRIKKIYMARIDTQSALSPYKAKLRTESTKARKVMSQEGMRPSARPSQVVFGIVQKRRISRSNNVIVELENIEKVCKDCGNTVNYQSTTPPKDDDVYCPFCNNKARNRLEDRHSTIFCVIPTTREGLKGKQLAEKANSLLLDEVVCISGFVDNDGRMIADDVLFPDIPTARQIGHAKRDIYAAFISDLHCGSQEFLGDELDQFIAWLNGKDVDTSDKTMVENTKYLFIAGDLVDGISVYPGQRYHLEVTSLYDQYALIASKLRKLPKRVKVFCIPGNHDAARQALPKPPIQRTFAEPLYKLDNITMLGDPSQVIVEGVNVLITHGDSLDDLVTMIPGASYTKPAMPMKELLKKRHLAPFYGGKTELAPLHRDWMVIDTPPDVVHFGHAHHNAVDNYRGVQIINSGTFQSQTDFMRKQGIVPTPGIVTFLNLRTGSPELKFFYDLSQQNQRT